MIPVSWSEMQCPITMQKEYRKVAKVQPDYIEYIEQVDNDASEEAQRMNDNPWVDHETDFFFRFFPHNYLISTAP